MRLLKIGLNGELNLTTYMAVSPPSYAILSHTWGPAEDEVSFEDLRHKAPLDKSGYAKLWYCANQARADGLEYCWIDTCCIDKSSSAELSEAINSMYQWYENAVVCYVYLSDVESTDQLEDSAWFTRGWTLQELIAPTKVVIFNRHWMQLGTKNGLQGRLSQITGVPTRILRGSNPQDCSVAQRMSWAAKRRTTRPEDIAYCLLGLFDINMSMHYGEGAKAFRRLQQKLMRVSEDHSILAWSRDDSESEDLLARSPADFATCANVVSAPTTSMPEQYSMTNVGLSISLSMIPWAMHTYLALLECQDQTPHKELMPQWRKQAENNRIGIFLRQTQRDGQLIRIAISGRQIYSVKPDEVSFGLKRKRVLILQQPKTTIAQKDYFMYGFLFRNLLGIIVDSSGDSQLRSNIIGRNTPVQRVWSDGLTANSVAGAVGNDRYVLTVTLANGERGLVSIFEVFTTTASGDAVLVEFGFDYDFNPVCLLRKYATEAQHANSREGRKSILQSETLLDQWMQDFEKHCIHAVSSSETDPLEAEEHFKPLPDRQAGGMYCALRGDRCHGLHARFPELNFQISIVQGLESRRSRAWIVDINSLVLPGIWRPGEHQVADALREQAQHNAQCSAATSGEKPRGVILTDHINEALAGHVFAA